MTTHGDKEYDGIIIGAGHNGMILQGYLLKAGLSVAVVERHLEVGGGLDAHENPRAHGFWHNIHSQNHRAVPDLPWFKDLELASYGQEYIRPEWAVGMLFRDKTCLLWHNDDVEQTCASIARFSEKDAKTFRDFHHSFKPVAQLILAPETYSPPMEADKKRALLENTEVGKAYYQYADRTIKDVVEEVFESSQTKAMVSYLFLLRGNELDEPGQGYIVPAACALGISSYISRGTSHRMAHTLNQMVIKNGGEVFEGQAAVEILIENGRAAGVRLADGRVLKARHFVASTVNPQQTFLGLIKGEHIDSNLQEKARNFKYSETTPIMTVHLALNERPKWVAAEYDPHILDAWLMVMGVDSTEDIYSLIDDCRAGKIPSRRQLLGGTPTIFDPTQAPEGKHVSWFWQIAPYLLQEGPEHWDKIIDQLCEEQIELLREFAPNLDDNNIIDWFGQSPLDIERHFPNMQHGDWMCGELNRNQFLDKRPFPECSQYRTPVEGLYIAGASCHPGGNITGAPAYNAAGVIVKDLDANLWWKAPDLEKLWENLGETEKTAVGGSYSPGGD
ncbi:MAG: NAD(P)/FAD-dependent oxidoreductase [Acidobacteria bacterium]|nr:NAD(P)/FAD-dependent oxidoreductase [Acidobacteriota bacterium]